MLAKIFVPTALLLAAACARAPERPNVLLITVDTLRIDRLSSLGHARPTTPELDALAAEGLLFTHCQSPRAKTTPALASLMTGLYPHEHGVRDLTMPLGRSVPVLAEALRDAGYRTGAIVGNFVLRRELSGLERGFQRWTEELPDTQGVPPDDVPQRRATSMTDGALAELGLAGAPARLAPGGEPWFLWLHYMDPHGSYDPPSEHRRFESSAPDPIPPDPGSRPGELNRYWVAEYYVPDEARLADGTIDAARVRDRYDGEVHYVDAEIGRLVDALRADGRLADTIVIVTADHGESLGEHSYWFEHGRHAYEVTCRVPLIVRLPDAMRRRPAPGRRDSDLSLVDLTPTLLELLDLPQLRRLDGVDPSGQRGVPRDRLLLEGDPQAGTFSRAVFCEKIERAEKSQTIQTKAVRFGDWKLIRRYTQLFEPGAGPDERELIVLSEELYDLAADPYETVNRIADPPPGAPLERLQAELFAFSRADVNFADLARLLQFKREQLERTDRETLRILEALGY